jgi:hypothetical protein
LGQNFQIINMHQMRSPNISLENSQSTNVKSKHAFHLELWAKSYCQKKGQKIKLTTWLPTIKTQETRIKWPSIKICKHFWKDLEKGYNIVWLHLQNNPTLMELWSFKVLGHYLSQFWSFGNLCWDSHEFWPFQCNLYGQS